MFWRGALLCIAAMTLEWDGAEAVNKKVFKTCAQSGFCTRQRAYASSPTHSWMIRDGSVREDDGGVMGLIVRDDGKVELSISILCYADDIVRVLIDEPSRKPPRYRIPPNDIVQDAKLSKLRPRLVRDDEAKGAQIFVGTSIVDLKFAPLSLKVSRDGQVLQALNLNGMFNFESSPDVHADEQSETFNSWTDPQVHGVQSFACDVSFLGATHVYGIPEHASSLSLKSTRTKNPFFSAEYSEPYRLYNLDVFEYELDSPAALYGSIPFMIGYAAGMHRSATGIFWNNPSETWIDVYDRKDFSNQRVAHFSSEAGVLDLFLFSGSKFEDVLAQYYRVTGTPQLPPLFSLAYHQCRWNYVDEKDVLEVHSKFSKKRIPLDVIWLDIEFTDAKKYFTWSPSAFPDPVGMQEKMVGRRLVTIVDPHIKKEHGYNLYDDLQTSPGLSVSKPQDGGAFEGDCWPEKSIWPDFANPLTRAWWAKQFEFGSHAGFTEKTFIWNDMNEPSVFNSPEITMPKDVLHLEGTVEHRNLHNLYGFYMHRATFEGLNGRCGEKYRPFVLTRAFYAASQRYAAAWTGDNKADWSHLRAATAMLLSLSVAGMPFVGADVGGFFGNPEPELLMRWYQLGALQPFFRAHAHIETDRREPWLIAEPYRSEIEAAIRMRYQLLPYIYTLFKESSLGGKPVIRPMFFEFAEDPKCADLDDQFMLGGALLAKPITEQAVQTVKVYLPPSSIWYDYVGLVRVSPEEDSLASFNADLTTVPLFVRGGSVIFTKNRVRRSSKMMQHDPYTLIVTLDKKGEAQGEFYCDDGSTHDYVEGKFVASTVSFGSNTLSCSLTSTPQADIAANVERIVIAGLFCEPLSVRLTRRDSSLKVDLGYEMEGGCVVIKLPGISLADPMWIISVAC